MEPKPRPALYEAYWQLAAERQAIFHRRVRGDLAPWTADPILARYKFCNSYRASDRVSQFLIREVIHGEAARGLSPEKLFMRVVLFRLFSRPSTWNYLEEATGGVGRVDLDVDRLGALLDRIRDTEPIYTSAFILPGHSPFGFHSKHRNHLALVDLMFRHDGLGGRIEHAPSLRSVYSMLLEYPTIGPFLAYQIAVDLNYTEQLQFSENEFTMPGPGAIRGLRKVFLDFGGWSPQRLILHMVDIQETAFASLRLPFQNLFGRRLHAIDCQGLFCEVDKYSRVAFPELKSNRVRIKREFAPSNPAIRLFYPPKWGINAGLQTLGTGNTGSPDIKARETSLGRHLRQEQLPLHA